MKGGGAAFTSNYATSLVMLSTFSGHARTVSIVVVTNSQEYLPEVQKMLDAIVLNNPPADTAAENNAGYATTNQTQHKRIFRFTTTNFDDGWTATSKEDWVEVIKDDFKTLVHYPNPKADAYNSILKEGDFTAWNILVAPRYSNLRNFEWKSIQSWESISFMEADANETTTGKAVHIVLFKKHYSKGNGRYLEIITNNKAA